MKKIFISSLFTLLVVSGCSLTQTNQKTVQKILTPDEASSTALSFINTNLMQPGSKATIESVTDDGDLYKLAVNVGGQNVNSYITKDGKTFFPQGMDIAPAHKDNTNNNSQNTPAASAPKTDKPDVELFVMSYCPYGTQTEKGIIPAVEALGDKIDFKIEFVDYSMHGHKEIAENLNQYCIQKNEPTKYLPYLNCFLKNSDGPACLTQEKIDQAKLEPCVSATDKEYKITELENDKSTWSGGTYPQFNVDKDNNTKYGVKGSPTVVINGVTVSPNRDSASLLSAICSAFNTKPAECDKKLSSTAPSPGFGSDASASGSGSTGSCN